MADPASQLTLSQENNLLNLLHEAAEELRGLLQPAKAREETGHRDSAGVHTRLFQILRMFCEVQTQRVCVLREVLCGTANTLTGLRMCSNLTHTFPDTETLEITADVDASCGSHFFQDHVTDVILNVLEDVHVIVNQFSVMSKRLDNGIAFLTEISGERGDLASTGPLDTADHSKPESCDISIRLDQHPADHLLANAQSTRLPDPVNRCTLDNRNKSEESSHEETRVDSPYKTMVTDCKNCLNMNVEVEEEKEGEEREKSRGRDGERLKHTLVTVG
ncbi:hypothetical protein DPX16_12502 [Anabarilius grahami]|uniref:Uncharacterized protein n=1 Tax=Anabarilius grahami TaxID=495550 RepID=A0A3N0Y0Z1_ANAGA|nr:hypothetical protein DPX16_12502 [Anabarilius grahami]